MEYHHCRNMREQQCHRHFNIEHMTRIIIREATDIEERLNNMNTPDDTQCPASTWEPFLNRITNTSETTRSEPMFRKRVTSVYFKLQPESPRQRKSQNKLPS